jgi:hypothetical protein
MTDNSAHESPCDPSSQREVLLRIFLETFDLYLRSVSEISAETGIRGLSVETLMAYWLSLPEADELIYGFIRGDLTLFPNQVRDLFDRETRRLELDPDEAPPMHPTTPIAAKSGAANGDRRGPRRGSNLVNFIKDNPEVYRQVQDSPKAFLVRWVMLHLMERAQARERGHRVVHEFFSNHPEYRESIRALAMKPSVPMRPNSARVRL